MSVTNLECDFFFNIILHTVIAQILVIVLKESSFEGKFLLIINLPGYTLFDSTPCGWDVWDGPCFSISSSLFYFLTTTTPNPNEKEMSIRQRFSHALLRQLTRHLRLANHPLFGTRLYILPLNWDTLMKIRLTLCWVEDHNVMNLDYWNIVKLFSFYCKRCHPIEYNMKPKDYILYL